MTNSLERASSVAKFVELRSVSMTAATLATSMHPLRLPSSLEIQTRYRAEPDKNDPENLVVKIDFEFEGRSADDAPEGQPAILLEATFALIYRWKPGASFPDGAEADFARLNGAYNVWPYWRELVQTVSGRVGLSGIIVPVFRASDFELRFKGITDRTDPPPKAIPAAG